MAMRTTIRTRDGATSVRLVAEDRRLVAEVSWSEDLLGSIGHEGIYHALNSGDEGYALIARIEEALRKPGAYR